MKSKKGITLISLVITIVILLILAGISIQTITNDNGLFNRTKQAKNNTLEAQNLENTILLEYENAINKTVGDSTIQLDSENIHIYIEQNLNNKQELTKIFSDSSEMEKICESEHARNLIYNNYEIFEPIISNSEICLEAMKNSSRYEIKSLTGQYKNYYDGKAFVLGMSCSGNSYGNYTCGEYLSGNFDWNNPRDYYSTTGLSYIVNKFASSVSINGVWGVSINWENNMYVAYFKI